MLLNASNYDGVSGAGRAITAVNTSHSFMEQIFQTVRLGYNPGGEPQGQKSFGTGKKSAFAERRLWTLFGRFLDLVGLLFAVWGGLLAKVPSKKGAFFPVPEGWSNVSKSSEIDCPKNIQNNHFRGRSPAATQTTLNLPGISSSNTNQTNLPAQTKSFQEVG